MPTVNNEKIALVLEESHQMLTSALFSGKHDPKNLPRDLKEAILLTLATMEFLMLSLPNSHS